MGVATPVHCHLLHNPHHFGMCVTNNAEGAGKLTACAGMPSARVLSKGGESLLPKSKSEKSVKAEKKKSGKSKSGKAAV